MLRSSRSFFVTYGVTCYRRADFCGEEMAEECLRVQNNGILRKCAMSTRAFLSCLYSFTQHQRLLKIKVYSLSFSIAHLTSRHTFQKQTSFSDQSGQLSFYFESPCPIHYTELFFHYRTTRMVTHTRYIDLHSWKSRCCAARPHDSCGKRKFDLYELKQATPKEPQLQMV